MDRGKMDRGQAHTLEAITAALLLLASLVIALQMTAVTPLSASTSSQHIENQQSSAARGVLAAAADQGALKDAVLYWNNSSEQFHDVESIGWYANDPPNNTFGWMLNRSFDERGIAYNVYVVYRQQSGNHRQMKMIYRGVPSDNAVVSARTVTIMDDDHLVRANGTRSNTTVLKSTVEYDDIQENEGTGIYNYVRVEVVAWRI